MVQADEDKGKVTPVAEWTVMGHPVRRVTGEAIVTGRQSIWQFVLRTRIS